jgi:hypothetical protein
MRGLSLNSVRTVAFDLTTAMALGICLVSPSFAQRDPFDLAQAGFVAKDRGEFTLAVRLIDAHHSEIRSVPHHAQSSVSRKLQLKLD